MPPQRMTTCIAAFPDQTDSSHHRIIIWRIVASIERETMEPKNASSMLDRFFSLFDRQNFFGRLNPKIVAVDGQIEIVVRIPAPLVLPALLEGLQFVGKNAGFGRPFVVVELSVRRENDPLALPDHVQAIINIVVIEGKAFIKP